MPYPPKKKELGENDLERSTNEDVAVYKKKDNPSPGVYRGKTAETIVPRDSDIDSEIGSQDKMAGEPEINLAGGGFIPDENMDLMGDLTPGTSQQQQTMMPPQTLPRIPNIPPAPISSRPPAPTPMAQAPAQSPVKLPGMPPSVTPDEIQGYLSKQKQNLSKYGPDAQMELQNQTLKQRNNIPNTIGRGMSTMADALMQGVARAGNPGFQKAYEDRQADQAKEQMATLQKANEGQIQQTEAGMKLDMMNPKSEISNAYRESFAPIFTDMGYQPEQVAKMSASQIGTVADMGIRYGDVKAQLALKKAMNDADITYKNSMLELEKLKAGEAIRNQKVLREQENKKTQMEAAMNVLKAKPRVLGIPVPLAGPSMSETNKALETISGQMSPDQEPQPTKEAPYGQTVKRGDVEYEWSPISGKYHRK